MLLTASLPQYGRVPPPCVSVGDVTASERVCVSPSFACLCTCPAQVHPALTPPTVPTRTRRGHPVTGVCPGICLHVPAAFLHRHQLDPRGRRVQLGHAPQPKRRGRDPVLPNPRGGYHYLLWGPSQALLKPGGCQRGDPTLGPAQPGPPAELSPCTKTLRHLPSPHCTESPCSLPGSRFCPRPVPSSFTCPPTPWLWSHRRPFVLGGAYSPECSRHHFLNEACTGGRAFQAAGTASEKALWQEHVAGVVCGTRRRPLAGEGQAQSRGGWGTG